MRSSGWTLGDQALDPEAIDYMTVILSQFKPRVGVQPPYRDEDLRGLTMPTLLVVGGRDPLFDSVRTAKRLEGILPDLRTAFLPDAGHVLTGLSPLTLPFLDHSRGARRRE